MNVITSVIDASTINTETYYSLCDNGMNYSHMVRLEKYCQPYGYNIPFIQPTNNVNEMIGVIKTRLQQVMAFISANNIVGFNTPHDNTLDKIYGVCDGVFYINDVINNNHRVVYINSSEQIGKYELCSNMINIADLDNPSDNGVQCYDIPDSWLSAE